MAPTTTELNYTDDINLLATNNVRYTRVWHLLPWGKANTVYWPWAKTTIGACYEQDPINHIKGKRWDLSLNGNDKIANPDNVNYWPRMINDAAPKGAIPYASDFCMTSEIMLFDKSGMNSAGVGDCLYGSGTNCNWTNNPWASDRYDGTGNNICNIGALELPPCEPPHRGYPDFYYPTATNARGAQKAYVRTMIDRTVNNNVIYEIENEHNQNDGGVWMNYWANFIHTYNPSRLVSYSSMAYLPWKFVDTPATWTDLDHALGDPGSKVDIVNLHLGQAEESAFPAILTNLNDYIRTRWAKNKPINVDEFGNWTTDPTRLRQMAWAIVTSGGHFHFEDVPVAHELVLSPIVNNIRAFVETPFGSAGLPWNFVGSKPFVGSDPNANLTISDEPFCMAHDPTDASGTQDYVCFFIQDHSTTGARLKAMPGGKYYVRWWNPRNKDAFDPATYDYYVQHAGGTDLWTTFAPPDSTGIDWVLFVRNEVPDAVPNPQPYDVAITNDDGRGVVLPGRAVTYAIKVTNPGSAFVVGATVTDTFPAVLQQVSWTCAGAGGATCTASGSSNINQTVDLPPGSTITFTATGTLSTTAAGTLTNPASVAAPSDPDASNNYATDVDLIGGSGAAFNFFTLKPCRLVDTRDPSPPPPIGGPLLETGGPKRDFAVIGKCGIPSGAKALAVSVTVTQPGAQGWVRLVPTGDSLATISTVNFQAGDTRASNSIVPISWDGKISAKAGGLPTVVHLIIDVNGYFQ